jgi:hypothetical protein
VAKARPPNLFFFGKDFLGEGDSRRRPSILGRIERSEYYEFIVGGPPDNFSHAIPFRWRGRTEEGMYYGYGKTVNSAHLLEAIQYPSLDGRLF